MAMMRYAKATVVRPTLSAQGWGKVRTAATNKAALSGNLLDQASSIFGKPFDPSKYLLTHATIVASVNTEKPANVKLGSVEEDGFRVNRKYANYRVTGGTEKYINNNMDCWDRQTLLKSYRTFIGAHNFVEHVQIEDLSKGRIIDAVARDIGDSVYVDILVATERKHTELVDAIQSGKMATMSMGCTIDFSVCTKCGNVAVDETEMCSHVRYMKGNTFFDENGTRRKIAELCGHPSVNPTGGVTFIEASWVETPAFEGAVMRNVLEAKAVPAKVMRQAQQVLSTVPAKWDAKARHKKARALHLAEDDFGFGGEGGEAEGGEAAAPAAPAEPPNPFKDIEDQVQQHILTRVLDNLKQQVEKGKNEAVAPNDTQSTGALDSTLNKQAARKYLTGLNALVKTARSDIDLIDRVAAYNQSMGVQIPTEIYRAAVRVGSAARYGSEQHFMTACRGCLGRKLSAAEANTLLRLGKLLDLYSHHG